MKSRTNHRPNAWKSVCAATLLVLCLLQNAVAEESQEFVPKIEFNCGGASVVIDSEPKGFRSPEEAFVSTGRIPQAQIVVIRGESRATFQGWQDIDYIGGQCVEDTKGNPHIVFQAICGGSGCDDLDHWGIIDPRALREELAPGKLNTDRAREILGKQPPRVRRWISLYPGR